MPIKTTIHERELQGCGRGVHTRAGTCTQVWARVHICACDCGGEKSPSGVTPQSPPTLLFATVFLIDLVLANSSVSPLSLSTSSELELKAGAITPSFCTEFWESTSGPHTV